jgi:hypothetical protein
MVQLAQLDLQELTAQMGYQVPMVRLVQLVLLERMGLSAQLALPDLA